MTEMRITSGGDCWNCLWADLCEVWLNTGTTPLCAGEETSEETSDEE